MPFLTVLERAYDTYPAREMPFLRQQAQGALLTQPYQGLKILHNVPLTMESLFKINVLLTGGADLTITQPNGILPPAVALELLKAAGLKLQIDHAFKDDFDLCLDYDGELVEWVTPRIGTVEMTKRGTRRYKSYPITYPVVSINNSQIKTLEISRGSGDGFIRAFQELTGITIYHQKFMVVGYGRVGQGIVHALSAHTQDIVVVDRHPDVVEIAREKGFHALLTSSTTAVEHQVKDCFAVVTATGREQVISRYFNPQVFKGRYLANMGHTDEFGQGFEIHEVLGNKKAINFAIATPILMRYLDPVFYAHNLSIDLLCSSHWQPRVYPFPPRIASDIVAAWKSYYDATRC